MKHLDEATQRNDKKTAEISRLKEEVKSLNAKNSETIQKLNILKGNLDSGSDNENITINEPK